MVSGVAFDAWPERILVQGEEDVLVTARRAKQGMVLAHDPAAGLAVARARAWEGKAVQDLMTWVWLATDHTLRGCRASTGGEKPPISICIRWIVMGSWAMFIAGIIPARAAGHDPRLPALGDGSVDWQGMRPYDDNPKVRNPSTGHIINWNNRPAPEWISSDLWSYTWSRADRVHILMDQVEAKSGATVADVVAINERSSFEDVNHRYLMSLLLAAVAEGVQR